MIVLAMLWAHPHVPSMQSLERQCSAQHAPQESRSRLGAQRVPQAGALQVVVAAVQAQPQVAGVLEQGCADIEKTLCHCAAHCCSRHDVLHPLRTRRPKLVSGGIIAADGWPLRASCARVHPFLCTLVVIGSM